MLLNQSTLVLYSAVKQYSLAVVVLVVHKLGEIGVVLLGNEFWLLDPATEVVRLIRESLSRSEAVFRFSVSAHGMCPREKLGRDFSVTLAHEVLVYHASAVACIVRNVLLTDFVSGSIHPILRVAGPGAEHISVDFPLFG